MVHDGGTSGARIVALEGVRDSVDAALALDSSGARPLVVVGTPGGSADAVMRAAQEALGAHVATGEFDSWAVLRSDMASDAAFERRHPPASDDPGRALLVPDAQWLGDAALARLLELTVAPSSEPVIVVHRHGLDRPVLGELRLSARRSNRLIDVGVLSAPSLEARGVAAAEAERLVRLTGGAAELLDLADDDHAFVAEIIARLSVVDERTRRVAELLAFGLDAGVLAASSLLDSPEEVDDALALLRVEGLIIGAGMPDGVAAAVRSACPAGRRSSLVDSIVEHGPAGASHDLATMLLEEGDRSTAAGALYAAAAHDLGPHDPDGAIAFADAAVESGIADGEVAVARAIARLGLGDPITAIADLADVRGADAELVRSGAWSALGDLASAAESAARSSEPPLAKWAELGIAAPDSDVQAGDPTSGHPETARRFAEVLDAWWAGTADVDDLIDDLQRIATRARADRSADRWPIAPELVAVQIAARDGDFASATRIAGRASVGAAHERARVALLAWIEARRGHLDAADEALAELTDGAGSPHDRLVVAGARCALAVREADGEQLEAAVGDARQALDEVPPHLHVLDVVTDMAAAASRTRADLGDVLARCERTARRDPDGRGGGDVARSRLIAALAGDDLDQIAAASTALLDRGAPSGVWRRIAELLVEPGAADPAAVVAIARELAETDASYEAARLCGVVALATGDADASRRLLKESRVWRTTRRQVAGTPGTDRSVVSLSEQEERVGRLVIDGHTHKQVGAALFISPKTVEHHVAHIRTKLGCANRAEMMTALREYLG